VGNLDRIRSRLTYANVVATLALLLALGLGGAYAAQVVKKNTVASSSIQKGAVKSSDLRNGGVKGKDVADGGITGSDVANEGLTGVDVAGDSLTGNDLDESSLSEVPSAQRATTASSADNAAQAGFADNAGLLGGIGPEDLVTARNEPQSFMCGTASAYEDCARVTIDLARPQRLFVIATAGWNAFGSPPVFGDCLLERNDNGIVLENESVVSSTAFDRSVITIQTVTPPIPAGSHFIDLSCRETDGDAEINPGRLTAIAVGAG
jgi:hypothetical protein